MIVIIISSPDGQKLEAYQKERYHPVTFKLFGEVEQRTVVTH